jgi:hypothetical protein
VATVSSTFELNHDKSFFSVQSQNIGAAFAASPCRNFGYQHKQVGVWNLCFFEQQILNFTASKEVSPGEWILLAGYSEMAMPEPLEVCLGDVQTDLLPRFSSPMARHHRNLMGVGDTTPSEPTGWSFGLLVFWSFGFLGLSGSKVNRQWALS